MYNSKKVETTPIVITDPHLDDKINKRYGRQNHRFEESQEIIFTILLINWMMNIKNYFKMKL